MIYLHYLIEYHSYLLIVFDGKTINNHNAKGREMNSFFSPYKAF